MASFESLKPTIKQKATQRKIIVKRHSQKLKLFLLSNLIILRQRKNEMRDDSGLEKNSHYHKSINFSKSRLTLTESHIIPKQSRFFRFQIAG